MQTDCCRCAIALCNKRSARERVSRTSWGQVTAPLLPAQGIRSHVPPQGKAGRFLLPVFLFPEQGALRRAPDALNAGYPGGCPLRPQHGDHRSPASPSEVTPPPGQCAMGYPPRSRLPALCGTGPKKSPSGLGRHRIRSGRLLFAGCCWLSARWRATQAGSASRRWPPGPRPKWIPKRPKCCRHGPDHRCFCGLPLGWRPAPRIPMPLPRRGGQPLAITTRTRASASMGVSPVRGRSLWVASHPVAARCRACR